jgi:hypothetical protein
MIHNPIYELNTTFLIDVSEDVVEDNSSHASRGEAAVLSCYNVSEMF